jgi:hypothetical protein
VPEDVRGTDAVGGAMRSPTRDDGSGDHPGWRACEPEGTATQADVAGGVPGELRRNRDGMPVQAITRDGLQGHVEGAQGQEHPEEHADPGPCGPG